MAGSPRPPERGRVPRGASLLPRALVSRGHSDRFRGVLKDDPEFTGRDAVYFYLAESLARTDKKAEAIPFFERAA